MRILGFEFKRSGEQTISPIPTDTTENNASIVVDTSPGAVLTASAVTIDNQSSTENGFIEQYRSMMYVPEVARCVQEVVSEAVVFPDDGTKAVDVDLSKIDLSDSVKKKISDAHDYIYDLLMFNRRGHEIFKRWYVDGRLNYFVTVDKENPKDGIQSVQYIDPRKIKRVREIQRAYDKDSKVISVMGERTYYLYNERGVGSSTANKSGLGVTAGPMAQSSIGMNSDAIISSDSIVYVPSGEVDPQSGFVLSYLHGAIRTANNLRMMEDAALIYRLARAPERRIFYVSTGNLPKAKSDQYVQELAAKNQSKIVYDVNTGEIKNDKKYLALTEDFWIPRREGSNSTEIDTLPGGTQVGEMGEAEYFKEKLYVALGIPSSRFEEQNAMFGVGTAITRDELRFSRVIDRLRSSFSVLFEELLKRQCILTNILSDEDWELFRNKIVFKFAEDNHFTEAVEQERLRGAAELLASFDQFVGKYISREYVYEKILMMNEDEMKHEQKLIAADKQLQAMMQQDLGNDEPPDEQATTEDFEYRRPLFSEMIEEDISNLIKASGGHLAAD